MNEKLDKIYSDPSNAGSYSGESGFIRGLKDRNMKVSKSQSNFWRLKRRLLYINLKGYTFQEKD